MINGYLTPAQMIEKKMLVIEENIRIEKEKVAQGKSDEKLLSQLEILKSEYKYAKIVLNE